MNPLHPRHLISQERLGEICDLLALGLVRRESSEREGETTTAREMKR